MELQKINSEHESKLKAFAESRIGGRPENQDSYGWADTKFGYLVTVCDGMGGGPGGKTASAIAVNEIINGIKEASSDETTANIIIKAIRRANMAIIEAGNDNPSLRGMGSTATVLLVSEQSAIVAHVGDSRVYQLRGARKIFRTFDHSMVFEMVAQGVITEEQARLSAQSNVITRALGIRPDVEVELKELPYEKYDRFMLCTDGVHGSMPEQQLLKLASNRKMKLGVVVDNIATTTDNIGRTTGGGHDNLTLAIVETNINSKLKPTMSKNVKMAFLSLMAALILSVVLNVALYVHAGKNDNTTMTKSELQWKILAEQRADSIKHLKQELNETCGEQVSAKSSLSNKTNTPTKKERTSVKH